ncbi:hypothetical protein BB559_000280 [Furculomyces boomerangus]|uniref:Extracellular membrane protein CFEM domain-containing protein n=1 Tax=Furculomyces boomerangus TaxID=61424 RepID=A0A2T9Z5N4_9FUNG|nr:hypothetical protein BB559_000280 [Furculomyces boomerangus]
MISVPSFFKKAILFFCVVNNICLMKTVLGACELETVFQACLEHIAVKKEYECTSPNDYDCICTWSAQALLCFNQCPEDPSKSAAREAASAKEIADCKNAETYGTRNKVVERPDTLLQTVPAQQQPVPPKLPPNLPPVSPPVSSPIGNKQVHNDLGLHLGSLLGSGAGARNSSNDIDMFFSGKKTKHTKNNTDGNRTDGDEMDSNDGVSGYVYFESNSVLCILLILAINI